MQNIKVERYEKASAEERATWPGGVKDVADQWQGWIEPEDKSWILFIASDGKPVFFPDRYKETGAVA